MVLGLASDKALNDLIPEQLTFLKTGVLCEPRCMLTTGFKSNLSVDGPKDLVERRSNCPLVKCCYESTYNSRDAV